MVCVCFNTCSILCYTALIAFPHGQERVFDKGQAQDQNTETDQTRIILLCCGLAAKKHKCFSTLIARGLCEVYYGIPDPAKAASLHAHDLQKKNPRENRIRS